MPKAPAQTKGKLFIISGPSGSGKTTLSKKLLSLRGLRGKLIRSVSATTRKKRTGETNGRDYFFIGKKSFLTKKAKGFFLEWQKVFNHFYGHPKASVEELLVSGKSVLLCIDVKGAHVVFKKCPQAVRIFILPPSMEILRERLQERNTETTQSLRLRLAVARRELCEAKHYQYSVINDKIPAALEKLERIVLSEIRREEQYDLRND